MMRHHDQLEPLLRLTLDAIDREFPAKPGHVLESAASIGRPREITPAFFGCFDWHSAVHGHWALVRSVKRFPQLSIANEIRERLGAHLNDENLSAELELFEKPANRSFERPYGWGWLLLLHAELASWDDADGRTWATTVEPLARLLAERLVEYLDALPAPIRVGTHANTAFSLVNALDAARLFGHRELERAILIRAYDFYFADQDYPVAWEPSGEDFLSPALAEVDVMRRVLSGEKFGAWLDRFLPSPDSDAFSSLRTPPRPQDPTDPRIGHLIGLCFHRAWCFGGLAAQLGEDDGRAATFNELAKRHLEAGLDQTFRSGYGGSHWLATFAVYTLSDAAPFSASE